MKKIAAILLPLALAACSSSSQQPPNAGAKATGPGMQVTLTETDRMQVQTAVKARIANESATFRTMLAQRSPDGTTMVCGYVNAGSGDTPFVGSLGGGSFSVSDIGGPTERTIAVQQTCHGRGIYL